MSKKSNWFVVATEGATTDGRNIHRSWIEQMAKNYDPQNTYGARINLEHIKLRWYEESEAHSKCYGDVLALKMEERADGKLKLLAQISPTEDLIALNKKRQKIYTSIEIDPNFADTGEAYLVGLAVTDDPASLGTEMLKFAAGASQNPLTARKIKPDNVFSEAVETVFEFVDVEEPKHEPSLFAKVKALLSGKSQKDDARFADQAQAVELLSDHVKTVTEKVDEQQQQAGNFRDDLAKLTAALTTLTERVDVIAQQPEPHFTPRPEITGQVEEKGRFF